MIPIDTRDKKSVICGVLQTAVANYLSKRDEKSEYIGPDLSSAVADNMGFFTGSILFAIMNRVYSHVVAKNSRKDDQI